MSAWPKWKVWHLIDGRRWPVLRLVQLRGGEWQLQTLAGEPAGVGLFADREPALKWAKTRCGRVDVVSA